MELQQARCRTSPVQPLIIAFYFLFGCILMNSAFAHQEDNQYDKSLKEQFLKEAPRRWAEYAEKTKHLQGQFSFTVIESHGSATTTSKNSYTLKKGAGDRLSLTATIETMRSKKKAKETTFYVDGFNPEYSFSLKRKDASKPWAATALTTSQKTPRSVMERMDRQVDFNVNHLVYSESERLADIVRVADFRVIGCRLIRASGDNLVLVDFDYTHEKARRGYFVQSGTLVLDPLRFWCLRSYNVRIKTLEGGQGILKFTSVKWRDTDGFPVPIATLLETDFTEDNIRSKVKREFNYDLSIPDSLPPDSEFTLSAYDLPEPKVPGRRIPLYVRAAVAGVCCLIIGVLLFWRVRRAKQGA